jgi:signal transduction histidine kinase
MLENFVKKRIKISTIFTPLAIVILSCSALIIINYLTIKTLSASRAYINGESHYSQAQKDGTRHLITYLFTKDTLEWDQFIEDMRVPVGDSDAREAFLNNKDVAIVKEGLRIGRNNEKDLNDMIWLYKYFQNVSLFSDAITEWKKGDVLIQELQSIGNQINKKIHSGTLSEKDKKIFINKIGVNSIELTKMEHQFSNILGEGTRVIKSYLLILNIFITLIIIGCISIYYNVMVNKIKRSNTETDEKNRNLIRVNKELDKFVYSASHDLRAPISSLQGLIEVMQLEDDMSQFKIYLNLMSESLNKQDKYIKDIIDYSRNTRKQKTISEVNLKTIIDEAIVQHKFTKESENIKITTNLEVEQIKSDELKLKIIINNFLSNAIKYCDPKKENQSLHIKSYRDKNCIKIEFIDNGIGIDLAYHDKIFEMFFVTNSANNGSGLGLYIVKEAIENLNGSITVCSEVAVGTTFIVTIPEKHETKL